MDFQQVFLCKPHPQQQTLVFVLVFTYNNLKVLNERLKHSSMLRMISTALSIDF